MNYKNLSNSELLMDAYVKEQKGVLVPIAIELAARLTTHENIDLSEAKALEAELDKLKRDYEIE